MVLRDVQGREVVVILLHLRPLSDAVAQAQEQIDDLLGGGDQRMTVAHGNAGGRCRHIDALPCDPLRHRRLLHRLKALPQQRLHLGLEHIGPLPHHRPLVTGKFAHGAENTGEASLLAQQSHPQLLERISISGFGNFGRGLLLKRVQLIGELLQSDWGAHGSGAEGD